MGLRQSTKLPQPSGAIKQILKKCSSFGKKSSHDVDGFPRDVPKGHCVIYVGENRVRFIVPVAWMNHPKMREFLKISAEEYGYKQEGGITLPCDELVFRQLTFWLI